VGVDLSDTSVLVRARNPQRFFSDFTKLVLEEWYEISHLETLDDSTEAVLGYLLGGTRG
jgi:ABC-2 type transport system ATP-binding protein